ncbi:MAG: HNH endonuclease [Proteobacteria bacterium]|nr:HNH endonuclease [Pseudomonadota bacterium]
MPKKGYKQTEEHIRKKALSKIHNMEYVWNYINKKNENGCWNWTKQLVDGYGAIQINCKAYKAHRVVYELTYDLIPDGMHVLHSCDNRKCCNPKHLFLGTNKDNVNDKVKKDRQAKGEDNHSKLTEEQVLEIRRLYSLGNYSQKKLAKMFGVGHTIIGNIILRKKWKHI